MAVSKNAAGYSGLTDDEQKQLKELLNKAQQAPKVSGGSAMTDASKRLLPSVCVERVIQNSRQLDPQLLRASYSEVKIARRFHCRRIAL